MRSQFPGSQTPPPASPPARAELRVAHIEMGRHWVGGPNQVLFLCRGLHERGVDSWLICPPESPLGQKAEDLGLNVRYLPSLGDMDPRMYLRAQRLLRELRPDIVHLHSRRGADTWGALAARSAGVPRVILSRRVDDPPGKGVIRQWKYGLGCDHIIAISEGIRRVLIEWGVPPEKVTCVRSAIDMAPYDARKTNPEGLRRRFGVPEDAPLVVTMAQLIPRKGHRTLLDAAPRILERLPETRFLFCGEGADRPNLEALVAEEGLKDRVIFAGFVQDIPSLLAAADVVAHPAFREGLGIAILEAMGMGVPVVAAAAGGIPEVVAPETGFLIEPGDAQALGEDLIRLLSDPTLRRRMGEAASERIRREFNVEEMVSGNLAVYRRVLAQNPASSR